MYKTHRPLLLFLLLWQLIFATLADAQVPVSEAGSSEQQSAESDTEERRVKRLGDASAEDWEPALNAPALPGGNPEQFDPYELPDPAQNAYLESLLSRLAARPGNQEALTELEALLDSVLDQANEQGDLENQAAMRRLLGVVQNVNPRKAGLSDAYQRLDALTQINTWIAKANAAFERGDLVQPAADNAHEWTRKVLRTSPENPEAQSLKRAIHEQLIERALLSAGELDFEKAQAWLEEASEIGDDQELVEQALIKIALIKQAEADQIEAQILEAIESGNFDLAEFVLIDLIALTGHTSLVTELREELRVARVYGQYEPGQVIQDPFINAPGSAPAVVVIQPGSFLMGSVSSEQGRSENEGPQHRVTFSRGFAMGLQEVTVGQFRSFIEATRHRTYADEAGRSRVYDEKTGRISERTGINWAYDYEGNRAAENAPVLHVTWHDAKAFVAWLSLETGKVYRLPSEAEYEYVMRAGTVTRYWWGDGRPEIAVENLTGAEDTSPSGRVWTTAFRRYGDGFWGPAPGASFPPNPWGLHDMAGNVSEWVEDCWHDTYALAPEDGSAWINPGCTRKVIRGGYWASAPDQSRSAARLSGGESLSGPRVGFRVARDL